VIRPESYVPEISTAIEATTGEDWSASEEEGGVYIWTASSQGWTILLVCRGDTSDGTATRGGTVVHLTPELVDQASAKLLVGQADVERKALAKKVLGRSRFRGLRGSGAEVAVQAWLDQCGPEWQGREEEERVLVRFLDGFLSGAKDAVKKAGGPEALIASRKRRALVEKALGLAKSKVLDARAEVIVERWATGAGPWLGQEKEIANLVKLLNLWESIPEDRPADGADRVRLEETMAEIGKLAGLDPRAVDSAGGFADLMTGHAYNAPALSGRPDLGRDLDLAAELETNRLIDKARSETGAPIRSIGLEGPGVDEVRHLLDGHGFDTQRFYERDQEWSRDLEPPAWRVRRMHKDEIETLIPPEQRDKLDELKARSKPGKMLRAVVIFFLRDGGVDYRVRIPAVQTRAGKWAVLNIYEGEILELDELDEMAARVAADSLSANLTDKERALWRTTCAACAAPFETEPNLKVRWKKDGQEAFVHPACWDEEPLLLLSAFLARGVPTPKAQAVTRATGLLATRMAKEGPYSILNNWKAEWDEEYLRQVRIVVVEGLKEHSESLRFPDPDLVEKVQLNMDKDVNDLAAEAGVDLGVLLGEVIDHGLKERRDRDVANHMGTILRQHQDYVDAKERGVSPDARPQAPIVKDYVLALRVGSRHADEVTPKEAKAIHHEFSAALADWSRVSKISEEDCLDFVDREIAWRERGAPEVDRWQDQCGVCEEPLNYGPVAILETKECHLACYPGYREGQRRALDEALDADANAYDPHTFEELVTGVRFAMASKDLWDDMSRDERYDAMITAESTASLSQLVAGCWSDGPPPGLVTDPERMCENWEQIWPGLCERTLADLGARGGKSLVDGTSKKFPFAAIWIMWGVVHDCSVRGCVGCGEVDLIEWDDAEDLRDGQDDCPRCNPDPDWCPAMGTRVRVKVPEDIYPHRDHRNQYQYAVPGFVGVVRGPWQLGCIVPGAEGEHRNGPYTGQVEVTVPNSNEAAEPWRKDPLGPDVPGYVPGDLGRGVSGLPLDLDDLEIIQTPCTKKAPCFGNLRCKRHSKQAARLYGNLDVSAGLKRVQREESISDKDMDSLVGDPLLLTAFLSAENNGPELLDRFKKLKEIYTEGRGTSGR
jgi:hypothetical protein